MATVGCTLTGRAIIACNGRESPVARAIGGDRKGKISLLLYAVAVPLAFVAQALALACYLAVVLLWFVPDRRIEHVLMDRRPD
jgi:uncharacterized membrane protein